MYDDTLHELIGDIYETSLHTDKWNSLIFRLSLYLSGFTDEQYHNQEQNALTGTQHNVVAFRDEKAMPGFHSGNRERIAKILDLHFNRACKISESINRTDQKRIALEATLNAINIPVVIVSRHQKVMFSNNQANEFINQHGIISIDNDYFTVTSRIAKQRFHTMLDTVFSQNIITSCELNQPGCGVTTVALMTPLQNTDNTGAEHAAILITTQKQDFEVNDEEMRSLYDITKAETRLVNHLIKGHSLKEASELINVSMGTLRSQLKSIFQKTGVSRQAELVRLILLGHNRILANLNQPQDDTSVYNRTSSNQSITLKDGRILGYGEYGDTDGRVVIGCHPVTGSRLQNHPHEEVLHQLGIRLIIPDRPGFGLSSSKPGRDFNDWADDVEQLVAQLDIKKFSALAYCGGTPYALSCAIRMASKVDKVLLISPVTPYDGIDLLHGITPPNRLLVKIASHLPASVFHVGKILAQNLVPNPGRYFDDVIHELCPSDAAALNAPEFMDNFQKSLEESLKQGPAEFANEQVMLANDWKLNLAAIEAPVIIWHGDEDRHVPIHFSEKFSRDFKHGDFNLSQGHGHFMVYHLWKDILESL
jgi:pimeloyl-ACP methyl ester carboxylesterase/DNA-binding CsgD family transcriptional regulator